VKLANLFDSVPTNLDTEFFEPILQADSFRLERIVSLGHSTPPGEWYDQQQDEWVLLISGAAVLAIEGEDAPVRLNTGDHLLLPAHVKHRVEWTAPDVRTVWLALHYTR
jgi:cupin 2 domain-containing protein